MKNVLALMLTAFIALTGTGRGQTSTGTIRGTLLDPSGAAVPGAEVKATNLSTNVATVVRATEAGVYVIPGLIPGDYRVEVAVTGFKTVRREPVNVFTAATTTVDTQLEVGEVTQTVDVTGSSIKLDTTGSEMSTEIEKRAVFDLPLQIDSRRSLDSFIVLTPGVTGSARSINGSPDLAGETVIDGVSWQINVVPGNLGTFGPPYEAVEEFKVQTSLFPAEYSRGLGVTNFTMKSGTNEFHGNAFHILRNDKLEANSFFGNRAGIPRPIVRQNEWGVSGGGPIIKDKTFFYAAYTGFKRRGGAALASVVTLPTPAMKRGDFSEWLDTSKTGASSPIVIYDPTTTRPDGAGGSVRDPFPGNIIPNNRISRVAGLVVGDVPNPDFGGLNQNWVSRASSPVNDYDWSVKIDHNISTRQKLAYSMWIKNNQNISNGNLPGPLDDGNVNDEAGRGFRLNHDFFIRPNLIHHIGVGYARRRSDFFPPETSTQNNENFYKIPNITMGPGKNTPAFRIDGIQDFGGNWDITIERGNTSNLVDNLTWIKGKHTFKGGIDFRRYQYNVNYCLECQGVSSFDNRATSQPNSPAFGSQGHPFASFLLGQAVSFRQERGVEPRGFRNGYYGVFFQDDVKLTPKLTMNAGFRVERPVTVHEQYDRLSALDLRMPNPGAGGIPGALAFAGEGPGRTGSSHFAAIQTDIAPRLGFSYQLNEKTVIRTGFGINYSQTNGNAADGNLVGSLGSGFNFIYFRETTDNGLTPAFSLDEGPPPVTLNLPNLDPTLQNGFGADYVNSDSGKTARTYTWVFDLQRELPGGILLDAAYVGQRGINMPAGLETINQVPGKYLSLGSLLDADVTSPAAVAAGIKVPFPGFTGSVAQALRPFPQYLDIVHWQEPTGMNMYHGLQMKIQKRFSKGLSFLVSYTASKTLSNASGGNAFSSGMSRPPLTEERGLEWAVAGNDVPQNLVASFVYELPFGPGKPFAQKGGAVGKIVGGWQVSGITRYYSGTPIGVAGGPSLPLFGGPNRPNAVPGAEIKRDLSDFDPTTDLYLNYNAFSAPAPFTRGNLAPRLPSTRRFATYNEDLSIFKRVPIHEQIVLEFRTEFYNAFNRVVFGAPSANWNSPAAFGRVSSAGAPRRIQFMLKLNF